MKNIHLKTFQDCTKDLIGLPYSSFDCWDIVKLFYKKVYSKDLDLGLNYAPPKLRDTNHKEWAVFSKDLINSNKHNFKKVNNPQFGDIVLLNIFGISAHLGIYINEKQILHTSSATGCMIDRLDRWKKRIDGYYRIDD